LQIVCAKVAKKNENKTAMSDKPTYSKQVIEIADYVYANPHKSTGQILSYFVPICHKNERTVKRYLKQAREYNKTRIQKQEQAKDEVLVESAKESVKSAILTRSESLEILSKIATGKSKKLSYADKIKAIQQLSKMENWEQINRDNDNQQDKTLIKLSDDREIEI